MLDLDSAAFSWCPSKDLRSSCPKGNYERYRNPKSQTDYMTAIKQEMDSGKYDFIFVSTHEDTRKNLHAAGIPFHLVYPAKSRKQEFNDIYVKRKDHEGMISFLMGNWDKLIDDCAQERRMNGGQNIAMTPETFLVDYSDNLKFGNVSSAVGPSRTNKKNHRLSPY